MISEKPVISKIFFTSLFTLTTLKILSPHFFFKAKTTLKPALEINSKSLASIIMFSLPMSLTASSNCPEFAEVILPTRYT